jgi:hypothetical protein
MIARLLLVGFEPMGHGGLRHMPIRGIDHHTDMTGVNKNDQDNLV